jgi:hypothetical protein
MNQAPKITKTLASAAVDVAEPGAAMDAAANRLHAVAIAGAKVAAVNRVAKGEIRIVAAVAIADSGQPMPLTPSAPSVKNGLSGLPAKQRSSHASMRHRRPAAMTGPIPRRRALNANVPSAAMSVANNPVRKPARRPQNATHQIPARRLHRALPPGRPLRPLPVALRRTFQRF